MLANHLVLKQGNLSYKKLYGCLLASRLVKFVLAEAGHRGYEEEFYLLGLPSKTLDAIIYYEKYVVLQPGILASEGVTTRQLLTEEEYRYLLGGTDYEA
mgnify:CR=1 FL=1